MLLRTTIPPRRDGTVIATVGDRRYTFSAGYGCDVLWCDVPDDDAAVLAALPAGVFVAEDGGDDPAEPAARATPKRRGRPPKAQV